MCIFIRNGFNYFSRSYASFIYLLMCSTKYMHGHSLCVALSRIMGAFGIWTHSILSLYLLQKTITIWGYEKCMHVLVLKKKPLSNRCIGNRNILEDNHPYIPPSPIIIKYEKYHHQYSLFHSPIWNTYSFFFSRNWPVRMTAYPKLTQRLWT